MSDIVRASGGRKRGYLGAQVVRDSDASLESRIGAKLKKRPDGCWQYSTFDDPTKYATLGAHRVHRVVYETLVGPIPEGHHVHHKCRKKFCCNPEHLEAVSPSDHRYAHGHDHLPKHLANKLRGLIDPAA